MYQANLKVPIKKVTLEQSKQSYLRTEVITSQAIAFSFPIIPNFFSSLSLNINLIFEKFHII